MKIGITASANSLESNIDPRFGRAEYFIIYENSTEETDIIENSFKNENGAGTKASRF